MSRPRPCCGGPGVMRAYGQGVGYLINNNFGTAAPCWADVTGGALGGAWVRIDGGSVGPIPGVLPGFHVMGYDHDKDWILLTQNNDYVITGFHGGGGLPDAHAVYAASVRECSDVLGTNAMEGETLIDETTGQGIADAVNPGGTDDFFFSWSCVSKSSGEWRIYFHAVWSTNNMDGTGDFGFLVGSTLYDGSDLQTHILNEDTLSYFALPNGPVGIPGTIAVVDGDIFTAQDNGDGTGKILTNGAGGSDIPNVLKETTGIVWKGSTLALRDDAGGDYGLYVGAGHDFVYIAFDDGDGNQWQGSPVSMGYAPKFKGLMFLCLVTNGPPDYWNPATVANFLVVVATGPVTAGNLLLQDGATPYDIVYGDAIVGLNDQAQRFWLTPIQFCALPIPSDLEPVELPEPPTDPPHPTCDDYDNIVDETATSFLLYHGGFGGCTDGTIVYENHVLEGSRSFLSTAQLNASDSAYPYCVTNSPGNFGYIWCDFLSSSDPATRYADPGVLWYTDTDPGVSKDEYYVASEWITTSCDNGYTTIDEYHILIQQFRFNWSGTDWELVDASFGNPVLFCFDFTTIIGTPTPAIVRADGTCSNTMVTTFSVTSGSTPCTDTPTFTIAGTITPPG